MDSHDIFAIIPACLWRHLTPHLNVRTLYSGEIYWCFSRKLSPRYKLLGPQGVLKTSQRVSTVTVVLSLCSTSYENGGYLKSTKFNSIQIFTVKIACTAYGYLAELHVMPVILTKTGTSVFPSHFKRLISFQSKFEVASQTTLRVN